MLANTPELHSGFERHLHTLVLLDFILICRGEFVIRDSKNRPGHFIRRIPAVLGNRMRTANDCRCGLSGLGLRIECEVGRVSVHWMVLSRVT
jgi:hypothetical protein